MERLVRMTDLDITVQTPEAMDSLLSGLMKDIQFTSARRQNLYTISYRNEDPKLAKDVVQAMVTILVESTLSKSREETDAAQDFLSKKIKDYEERLFAAENRIKEFKIKNVGLMPAEGRGYFNRLQNAQAELVKAQLQLNEAVQRRDELKRQLTGEEPVFGFGGTAPSMQTELRPLDIRIQRLQNQLDKLSLQYTKYHPSVISIKEKIKSLQNQKQKELKNIAVVSRRMPVLEQNPVYQQLKVSLGEVNADVASLTVRMKEYKKRVIRLKRLVDTIPKIESQLKSMNRDYEITKKNYNSLVERMESAKLSEQVAQTGEEVKFRLVEPPRIPLSSSGPNRKLLNSGVFIVGIVAGLLFASFLSQLRPVIFDQRALKRVSGLPVFGAVSMYMTFRLRFKRVLGLCGFYFIGVALLAFYGVVLVGKDFDISWDAAGYIVQLIRSSL